MKTDYGLQENIAKNLLFIDGINRVGKSVFSGIIPSLNKMEHLNFFTLLEHIVPALALGAIDHGFARSLIRTSMNELAYNIKLSRNVNFRYHDQTGVLNYKEPSLYYDRLNKNEGSTVVQELRETNVYIPFQTHNFLVNLEWLNVLKLDYKMISLFRNPIDIVHSWWVRGYGDRFNNDPQVFTTRLAVNGELLPWYSLGLERDWSKLNSIEKCIIFVVHLTKLSVKQYKKAENVDSVFLLTFEDFVTKPEEKIQDICEFLNTTPTVYTSQRIAQASCPRNIDYKGRQEKMSEIEKLSDESIYNELLTLTNDYEMNMYGII